MRKEVIQERNRILKKRAEKLYVELMIKLNQLRETRPDLENRIEKIVYNMDLGAIDAAGIWVNGLKGRRRTKPVPFDSCVFEEYRTCMMKIRHNENLIDSEKIYFDGDILITDPCYFVKKERKSAISAPDYRDFKISDKEFEQYFYKDIRTEKLKEYEERYEEWKKLHAPDWEKCNGGYNMGALGFHTYLCRDTLYGDWSCSVFNRLTNKRIGSFCADSGMTGVFLLDEVLKYNPNFDEYVTYPDAASVIRDFHGEIQTIVEEISGVYEEDTEFYKQGDVWKDYALHIVGTGNISFITKQTGF